MSTRYEVSADAYEVGTVFVREYNKLLGKIMSIQKVFTLSDIYSGTPGSLLKILLMPGIPVRILLVVYSLRMNEYSMSAV